MGRSESASICHVTSASLSGSYEVVRTLIEHHARQGHRIVLVYDTSRGLSPTLASDMPTGVKRLPWYVPREIAPLQDVSAFLTLWRILRSLRPDIVHLHCSKAGVLGRIVGALLGLRTVYSPHGIATLRTDVSFVTRQLYAAFEWIAGRFGGPLVACSCTEARAARHLARRVEIIPNGINLVELDRQIQQHGGVTPDSPFTIALLGRIAPQRDPLRVARLARASPPEWRWIWIGDGERGQLDAGDGRIEITGWLSREAALARLATTHLLLHASRWEGAPLAILEAMALRKPVVASDIVGNRDLVEDDRTGLLVPVHSDQPYLEALQRLAANADMCRAMGKAGRQQVETYYNLCRVLEIWDALYETLTN